MVRILVVLALALVTLTPPVLQAQDLNPSLDRARRQPINDGQGAAGISLGDTEEAVIKSLGGIPLKSRESSDGLLRELLYAAVDPQERWAFALRIVLGEGGVETIGIAVSRRAGSAFPYLGRTRKGYQFGESKDQLQARYGRPDDVFKRPPAAGEFWWYRSAGLVIEPGERTVEDASESMLTIVRPHLTAAEARRQALDLP